MLTIYFPAVFHPEAAGYSVSVPDLEGCFTQGDTLDEAVEMTREAIGLMLEGCTVPPSVCDPAAIRTTGRDFVMAVPFSWKVAGKHGESAYTGQRIETAL